ncbi:MAG: hypothetical protein ACUVRA_07435 [Candidatus Bathyarchaeaceae archaeon]
MSDEELKPRLKRLDYHLATGRLGGTGLKVKAEPIKLRAKPIDPEIRKALDKISDEYEELKRALGKIKANRRSGIPIDLPKELDTVERTVNRIIVLVEDALTRKAGD